MKSSAIFYVAFVLIALGSALFGLDWQPATLSAMPDADVTAYVAPVPPPKPVVVVAAPTPVTPPPATASPPVAIPAAPKQAAPRAAPVAQTPTAPQTAPLCDVAACAAAYRSFRESDCTYNPSFGDRKLCTKGVVPTAAPVAPVAPPAQAPAPVAQTPLPQAPDAPPSIIAPEPGAQPATAATSDLKCNVAACAAAYRSFRESDCTFNPSFGPRQVCKK